MTRPTMQERRSWDVQDALGKLIDLAPPYEMKWLGDVLHRLCDPRADLMDSHQAKALWDAFRLKEANIERFGKADLHTEIDDDAGEGEAYADHLGRLTDD